MYEKDETKHHSYAVPHCNTEAVWFDQGRDYFWYVAEQIKLAKREIYRRSKMYVDNIRYS